MADPSDYQSILWILGAGFSKPLGGPLLNGLFTPESVTRIRGVFKDHPGLQNVAEIEQVLSNGKGRLWEHAEEYLEQLDLALEHGPTVRILEQGFSNIKDWKALKSDAVRMLAAETCLFAKEANPELERWTPYVAWLSLLTPADRVLTFNYDRVIEIVDALVRKRGSQGVWIPTPSELDDPNFPMDKAAVVLKLHGSVDWVQRDGSIERDKDPEAALNCKPEELAMATPGPTKQRMVHGNGPLVTLWGRAEEALSKADAVVFVGYSMPATDGFTKQRLIEWIRKRSATRWAVRFREPGIEWSSLSIHTVLGHGWNESENRLEGLLKEIAPPYIAHKAWRMGAEDFLGLVTRKTILDYREQIGGLPGA